MRRKKRLRLLNCLFGMLFGILLLRLALGPFYSHSGLYTHLVWIVLFPINMLRGYGNGSIFVLFYVLLWSYVIVVRNAVYDEPLAKTLFKMFIWMSLVALPFLPFGIEYFSLVRYATTISSYQLRVLPFVALLVLLFLANRFFFRQNYLVAGAWALSNFLLIIVVITLADLLLLLKYQILFHALGYRMSLVNNFLSTMPLLALLVLMCLSVFYVFVFERQFLRLAPRERSLLSIMTPVGLSIALSLMLMIMRDDSRRYRYHDYRRGIATVYYAARDDRQMLSFDEGQFKFSSDRQNVFYPFGSFDLQDTLNRHARDILRMKIIEGLDYYRLERIIKILAHGPRNNDIFNRLRYIIEGKRYRIPGQFKYWTDYVRTRYEALDTDITVVGWVILNGSPLNQVEFFVNKVSYEERKSVEPIWQGKTDSHGRFEFTCYKETGLDSVYFQVGLSLHNTLIGSSVEFIKVVNPLPVFAEAGDFLLDTLQIEVLRYKGVPNLRKLNIQTTVTTDSFLLFVPHIALATPIRLAGLLSTSGSLQDVVLEYPALGADTLLRQMIFEQLDNSRFFLKDSERKIEIQIN
ncbi:hypothetical protein AMJ83_07295 [candidate division WOR_3 bacterium SM23_42]|uniref:Uncharacterized protein n=1 Tax=candidate division WOR_3 bacterium SM23_42 TaxID=1703779 RepID=A0A0S8FRN0_UNCW3|nr:MAG: hypothetical protein AMJ83_07295 [candidate division WOR_3 bacterium SM23_42]